MQDFFSFLGTLFKSLFTTSDIVILLWAIATAVIYWVTYDTTGRLRGHLWNSERRANPKEHREQTPAQILEHEDQALEMQGRMNQFYALFANFTAIFPLLGMLGTVKALVMLAPSLSVNGGDVEQFFHALTSTAWGIIFAVAFKVLDSFISVRVESNNKELDTLLERNSARRSAEKRESYEA